MPFQWWLIGIHGYKVSVFFRSVDMFFLKKTMIIAIFINFAG